MAQSSTSICMQCRCEFSNLLFKKNKRYCTRRKPSSTNPYLSVIDCGQMEVKS